MNYSLKYFGSGLAAICLMLCVNLSGYAQKISARDSLEILALYKKTPMKTVPGQGDREKMLGYSKTAFKMSQDRHFSFGMIVGYNAFGKYYAENNDFEKGEMYFRKAADLAIRTKNDKFAAKVLYSLSLVYIEKGNYNESFKAAEAGLGYATKIKDSLRMSNCYSSISDYYFFKSENLKAIAYLEKAINIQRKLKDSMQLARTIATGAVKYIKQQQHATALKLLGEAMVIAERQHNPLVFGIYSQIGGCYKDQGKTDQAEKYFLMALEGMEQIEQLKSQELMVLNNLGKIYAEKKQYALAEKYLKRALKAGEEIGSIGTVVFTHDVLAKIYAEQKKYKDAYFHSTQYQIYADSIASQDQIRAGEELSVKFETKEMAAKNKILQQENKLQKLKVQQEYANKKLILFTAVIIVLLLLVVILFLYNRYKQRNLRNANKNNELKRKLLLTQMNPHFIFNSIDNIQGLILNDQKEEAIDYLNKFSSLTRQILENSVENHITLQEELVMTTNYITIQQLLYNNHFDFEIIVGDDIDTESIMIPPMLTQPFIENAVKHGIKGKAQGGKITVRFYMENKALYFEVTDNGSGLQSKDGNKMHKSLATQMVRERLAINAGNKNIEINTSNLMVDNEIQGVQTKFEIPFIYDL